MSKNSQTKIALTLSHFLKFDKCPRKRKAERLFVQTVGQRWEAFDVFAMGYIARILLTKKPRCCTIYALLNVLKNVF